MSISQLVQWSGSVRTPQHIGIAVIRKDGKSRRTTGTTRRSRNLDSGPVKSREHHSQSTNEMENVPLCVVTTTCSLEGAGGVGTAQGVISVAYAEDNMLYRTNG